MSALRCFVVSHDPCWCHRCSGNSLWVCLLQLILHRGIFLVLVYQRRTAGSWKHTHRWKWRLCHGSVSPFKVLKRKKAEQKQSVCVWSKSRLLGKANSLRLPLSKPHMDIQRQAQPSASPLEILVKNTCFKMFSAKNLQIHPSGWFWKSVETHLSFSLFS